MLPQYPSGQAVSARRAGEPGWRVNHPAYQNIDGVIGGEEQKRFAVDLSDHSVRPVGEGAELIRDTRERALPR